MKTVWIVSEGSPGHISQSIGLVEALAAIIPLQSVIILGKTSVRGWIRPIVRTLMGTKGRPLNNYILNRITNLEIPADAKRPDLIVSSGGKSVFAARTLAERHKVPYVFIGEHKPYPAEWFHTIISPVPKESCKNSIDIELIPTPVTPEFIKQKGTTEKGLWCMIIGGASRSRRFNENDWRAIANGMNDLAVRKKIRWLLTTSRRTGKETEDLLKKQINPEFLEDAIWWADQPRRELYEFIARSEVLCVTQDSITMVTEAVSSGKPVVAIRPEKVQATTEDFSVTYFERLEKNKRAINIFCHNFSKLELDLEQFSQPNIAETTHTAKCLADRLFTSHKL